MQTVSFIGLSVEQNTSVLFCENQKVFSVHQQNGQTFNLSTISAPQAFLQTKQIDPLVSHRSSPCQTLKHQQAHFQRSEVKLKYPSIDLYDYTRFLIQTYQQSERIKMTALPRNHSRALTSYSRISSNFHANNAESLQLKQFWLRKSMFNPPPGLAQTFATRRHLAGVDVPRVQIIHCSSRWLLLQAPHVKSNFFEILKKGKLGNLEQQLLKLFKSFVSLVKSYGFFRPTQKMIFMERIEFKVWINQDIFSNTPLMPINQGKDSQKHFVIAFLAMLAACLQGWEKITNITTIQQTTKALEWRCKLAKGNLSAINASQYTNFKPEESYVSFHQSELGNGNNVINSQQLDYHNPLQSIKPILSNSFTLNQECLMNKVKDFRFHKKGFLDNQKTETEEYNQIRQTKKKFGLHSTSSSLGNFSEKYRNTIGKKKTVEKVEIQPQAPLSTPELPSIQTQIENLFADEQRQMQEGCDQAQLERIAQQIQEVLIW